MALVSPGVEVTVIDQSQYLSAAPASVPFILMATAANKSNPSGTGIAPGTLASNANKLYQITSQRDLVNIFGNPFFYKTTNGTPLQGYELNEYGLLAAYSVLGTTNLCYVLRANIDLSSLVGRVNRPSGTPIDGTYWLDTAQSTWGIFQFNQSTGQFSVITPIVVTDSLDLATSTGAPLASIGNIGQYAVTFITDANGFTQAGNPSLSYTYWYKNSSNTWVALGSNEWKNSWPTVQGSLAPTAVSSGSLIINTQTVAIPPSATVTQVATLINSANIPGVSAAQVGGKLNIYLDLGSTVVIDAGSTAAVLSDLGLTAGTYYGVTYVFGTNAQQPRWRATDAQPRPTGSVWVKTNAANQGTNFVMSQFSAATASFTNRIVQFTTSDWMATSTLDATGGSAIPAGTIYAQYSAGSSYAGPVQFWERFRTGAAVYTGSTTTASFAPGSTLQVQVSVPNSTSLSSASTVTLPSVGSPNATDFVTAWSAAGIPYTTAAVSSTGAIVLTHTAGGEIIMNDGLGGTVCAAAGFVSGTTAGAKWGPAKTLSYTNLATAPITGTGTGCTINLTTVGYNVTSVSVGSGSPTGYAVGDILEVTGGGFLGSPYQVRVVSAPSGVVASVALVSGLAAPQYSVQLSNWRTVAMVPNAISPTRYPANNTNWFYSVVNQVDIMTNVGGVWQGYRNISYANNGLPQAVGTPATDPAGPIISASAPTVQSDGTPLVYGDLWINTTDLENYPVINRWQNFNGEDQWIRIDNTDQTTENGVLFADARWASNGTTDPVNDPLPTIVSLLTSNYLDLDAPDATLYPQGTLLFNTRRSGYNVKQFRLNYFNANSFPGETLPPETSTWVTVSGNQTTGAPYMGRKAQRAMVVAALKSSISTNSAIRDEDTFFNLLACPNYCELQPDMITLNNDRNQTAYIIGDTPLRLTADATAITAWATNAAGATQTSEQGLVTRNSYMGIYYPSGITTDLTGSQVVVPASHMMLRTMIYNDTVAYPWFAPAGQRRGLVDNATNIGYIDSTTGEFVVDKNNQGLRNVEYTNFINPIAFFTNTGILNYGNKNSFDSQSALDRTNVARLVAYLRAQLQTAMRPFIFEPNDAVTRAEAKGVVSTLLNDIMSKRGLYDYIVVCDDTNNTPARIDRNELWIDVAIEPVKAIEFVYIPIRILNTGEIAGLTQNG